MRVKTTLLILLLVTGVAGAQSIMPIPDYGRTYSASAVTRGFYFEAPRDFTVVGLRVPNEKHVLQAGMAVYVMSTRPPAWPGTRTGGLWLYKGFVLASQVQSCNVPVRKGEWVGSLGACGDRSIVHNSYAAVAGPFRSDVAGLATTLRGFGTRTNVMAAQAKGAYYADDAGTVSRVEVHVSVSPARVSGPDTAAPGTTARFVLSAPSDKELAYQMGSSLGNGPILLGSRTLGLSPDSLLLLSVSGLLPSVFQSYGGIIAKASGGAAASLAVPNVPALRGLHIHSAFVTLSASAPFGVASISNSHVLEIR